MKEEPVVFRMRGSKFFEGAGMLQRSVGVRWDLSMSMLSRGV